ncbi:class I SAM-dependent DNA methyltransferase [Corynebacterium meridianum]|uniref:Class I SAM-dependent methyltransferase n=1 Tax=Corynebacterium meridianum TaxID=2765363 RepID=A0A934I5D1_9CORY|nr:methyltransferase domain-containing protein [Corynebacterium meridianum]MBI8988830.1 class I SAM-dependent methyltransferase [Corynebacterium meridianum]MCK7676480.1 class I SAM-dependent methyltransferase [Corynebacterium meridianum]
MPTWKEVLAANPDHSEQYAARWRTFAAQGRDLDGEARLMDALARKRGARILDAGCGTGRVGGVLAARGHEVTGVDLDPVLIGYAERDFPGSRWEVGDLTAGEVPDGEYDLIVSAGNVMTFLPADGRITALRTLAGVLAPDGRMAIGFGSGRGYGFDEFIADAAEAGLETQHRWGTWEIDPFTADSDFMVTVLVHRDS